MVFSRNEGPKCDSCQKQHELILLQSQGFLKADKPVPSHLSTLEYILHFFFMGESSEQLSSVIGPEADLRIFIGFN